MPEIAVSARAGAPEETSADTRAVPLFDGESLSDPGLQALVDSGEAKTGPGKVTVFHESADGSTRRVLIYGVGKREELTREKLRVAAAAIAGRARELGTKSLSIALPEGDGVPTVPETALVEGVVLKLYKFDRLKSKKDDEDDAS